MRVTCCSVSLLELFHLNVLFEAFADRPDRTELATLQGDSVVRNHSKQRIHGLEGETCFVGCQRGPKEDINTSPTNLWSRE